MAQELVRIRHDGWTPGKRAVFLHALKETSSVREACRYSGMSSTSAYRVKKRLPEFSDAWDQVLAYNAPALEKAAFSRAVDGWMEPVWHGGKMVGERWVFSEGLLKLLLTREDRRAEKRPEVPLDYSTPEETDAAIKSILATMRRLDEEPPEARAERAAYEAKYGDSAPAVRSTSAVGNGRGKG